MAQNMLVDEDQKISPLLGAIIKDTQLLVRQEMSLARTEIKEELQRVKSTLLTSSVGIYLSMIAGVLLGFTLAEVLFEMTELPMWACYGLTTALFGVVGVYLLAQAKAAAAKIDMVPRETVQSIKENVQWIKNRT